MFSIRLKELRQRHNLSQKEFASILKVSTGTVGNWEVGLREPNFEMLIKIADIFHVSCDYILDRVTDEKDGAGSAAVSESEEELLKEFRTAGKKFGKKGQQAILSMMKAFNGAGK